MFYIGLWSHVSCTQYYLDYDFMYLTNVLHWIMISCIMHKVLLGLWLHVSYKCFTLDYDLMYHAQSITWIMISCILQMFYIGIWSHVSCTTYYLHYDFMYLTMFYFELWSHVSYTVLLWIMISCLLHWVVSNFKLSIRVITKPNRNDLHVHVYMLTVANPTKITMTTMIAKFSMFYGETVTSSDIGTLHQPLYLCLLLWQLQRVRYIQNAFVFLLVDTCPFQHQE
jgi:hypothetical protein